MGTAQPELTATLESMESDKRKIEIVRDVWTDLTHDQDEVKHVYFQAKKIALLEGMASIFVLL